MGGYRHVIEQAARAHNENEASGLDDSHEIQVALRDVIFCGVMLMIAERDAKCTPAS